MESSGATAETRSQPKCRATTAIRRILSLSESLERIKYSMLDLSTSSGDLASDETRGLCITDKYCAGASVVRALSVPVERLGNKFSDDPRLQARSRRPLRSSRRRLALRVRQFSSC